MSTAEEKVEMEQVPLKSDTDAPATESTETPAQETEAAPEPAPAKKGWFFKKTKKTTVTTVTTEEPVAEGSEEPMKEEKPKKKCWWNREKSENEQKAEQISIGINLVDRDEKAINDHVKLDFHDIFGEAETSHSFDCVWRLLFKIFTWTRLFVYRILALIVGIPSAIFFAILFGIVTVFNTFICMPIGKLLLIPATWLAKTWNWLVHAVFDPVASSLGLFFSSFTIRKYGINSQPTDPCVA